MFDFQLISIILKVSMNLNHIPNLNPNFILRGSNVYQTYGKATWQQPFGGIPSFNRLIPDVYCERFTYKFNLKDLKNKGMSYFAVMSSSWRLFIFDMEVKNSA